jgi:hypothetical protein
LGTWGVGPFDNDTAADFADALDDVAMEERGILVRNALQGAANATDHLDYPAGVRAVVSAALVVAQSPGGEPVSSNYGPKEPMPDFPADLRVLAVDALHRVVAAPSELAEHWDETEDGRRWHQMILRLRDMLDPAISSAQQALFEI